MLTLTKNVTVCVHMNMFSYETGLRISPLSWILRVPCLIICSQSQNYSPLTLTVVSLLKLLSLHHTTHWYLVWSSVTVRNTGRRDVWFLPSDCRQARSLRSSVSSRESEEPDSDWITESGLVLCLNHCTLSSHLVAPWMVHFSSVGTWAYMMLGWLISETLNGTVKRNSSIFFSL